MSDQDVGARPVNKRLTVAGALDDDLTKVLLFALSVLGAVSGVRAAWQEVTELGVVLVGTILLLGALALRVVGNHRAAVTRKELPAKSVLFHPFKKVGGFRVPRPREVQDLTAVIGSAKGKLVAVVGQSGAGKSTFLRSDLADSFRDRSARVHVIDGSRDALRETIRELSQRPAQSPSIATASVVNNLLNWLDENKDLPSNPDQIGASVSSFCDTFICQDQVVVIFDQVERYFESLVGDPATAQISRAQKLFHALIIALREKENVTILFALRSDYLFEFFQCTDFLLQPTNESSESAVTLYILDGVSANNPEALRQVRENLDRIPGKPPYAKFSACVDFGRSQKSNTFLIQLVGYLCEHFYQESGELERLIEEERNVSSDYLDIYTEYLLQEYTGRIQKQDARFTLGAVLYAIAVATRSSGRGVELDRVAGLAHLPSADALEAIEFLKAKDVVVELDGRRKSYRIVHDLLADHFEGTALFDLRAELKEAVRFLCEKGRERAHLTTPSRIGHFLDFKGNFFLPGGRYNLTYIFLIILPAFGFLRIVFPEAVFERMKPINEFINGLYPGVIENFEFNSYYYVPIYVTLTVLAYFVYRIDIGYFQQVLKGNGLRTMANLILPVGGTVHAALVFAPGLLAVPIAVCGLWLGATLMLHSWSSELHGTARKSVRRWGYRSFVNNLLVLATAPYLVALIGSYRESAWEGGPTAEQWPVLTTIVLLSLCFTWLWWHIRPEQATREGWSARMGTIDQARAAANEK